MYVSFCWFSGIKRHLLRTPLHNHPQPRRRVLDKIGRRILQCHSSPKARLAVTVLRSLLCDLSDPIFKKVVISPRANRPKGGIRLISTVCFLYYCLPSGPFRCRAYAHQLVDYRLLGHVRSKTGTKKQGPTSSDGVWNHAFDSSRLTRHGRCQRPLMVSRSTTFVPIARSESSVPRRRLFQSLDMSLRDQYFHLGLYGLRV